MINSRTRNYRGKKNKKKTNVKDISYVRSYPCVRMISESDIVLMYRRLRNIFEKKKNGRTIDIFINAFRVNNSRSE